MRSAELERGLLISEEVLRHLISASSARSGPLRGRDAEADAEVNPPPDDEEPDDEQELIDESESEAALPRSTEARARRSWRHARCR